jgi:hypothetical protein
MQNRALKVVSLDPAAVIERAKAPNPERDTAHEHLASVEFYSSNKREIFKLLCARGDPAPRVLQAGSGKSTTMCTNVRVGIGLFRAAGRVVEVVRGWKLLVVAAPGTIGDGSWRAVPHAVLRDKASGRMHCFTADPGGDRFVFLPSSRMAAALTNDEFLKGDRVYRSVVGGNSTYVQLACDAFPMALARSPELALPYPLSKTLVPAGVMAWIRTHAPESLDAVETACDMGFPCMAADAEGAMPHNALVIECKQAIDDAVRRGLEVEAALDTLTPILQPLLAKVPREQTPVSSRMFTVA